MVECVDARVVRDAAVIERVLDELEARQPDRLHVLVVGAAGLAGGHRAGAHAVERREPFLQQRNRADVVLGIDAADLADAVVEVEIGLEVVVPRLLLDRERPRPLGEIVERAEPGIDRAVRQVLLDIGGRAHDRLLLAAPQREADRPPGLHAEALDDPRSLDHHHARYPVVGRPVGGDPAIEVAAGHDVAGLWIAARDVGDEVVGGQVPVAGSRGDLEADDRRLAGRLEPRQPAIVLGAELHERQRQRVARRNQVTFAGDQAPVAIALADHRHRALGFEEARQLERELVALDELLVDPEIVVRQVVLVELGQVAVLVAPERRGRPLARLTRQADHHDLAGKLAAPLLEVFLLAHRREDHRRADRPVGRRRPGHRHRPHHHAARLDHPRRPAIEVPGEAEGIDLLVDVLQPIGLELGQRPVGRLVEVFRVGQPRANPVHQLRRVLQRLAVADALVDDLVDLRFGGVGINGLDRQSQQGECGRAAEKLAIHRDPHG